MLCLSRKVNEKLVIRTPSGECIRVLVVRVEGHKVKLGVEADCSVSVDREEIDRRKRPGDYAA